jgi:hypothetical protein
MAEGKSLTQFHDQKLGTDIDDTKLTLQATRQLSISVHSGTRDAHMAKGLISRKNIRPIASGRHCRLCAGHLATSTSRCIRVNTAKPRLFRPVRFSRISNVPHHFGEKLAGAPQSLLAPLRTETVLRGFYSTLSLFFREEICRDFPSQTLADNFCKSFSKEGLSHSNRDFQQGQIGLPGLSLAGKHRKH